MPFLARALITLFLCGDVMTGRGIDRILPHPGDPRLQETYMKSAAGYVELAERANGPIARPVDFAYVWGDALPALDEAAPDVRLVNLETAVTASGAFWPGKAVHYRMHPANVPVLSAAGIDVAALANNHVLDFGRAGLAETLATLHEAGIKTAGAGMDRQEAAAPAVVALPGRGRVLVFALGAPTSGIPALWAAAPGRSGVNFLPDLSAAEATRLTKEVRRVKRPGDLVVASIHWGGNWGFAIPEEERAFAHRLIDEAGVDLVHGHSAHHVQGIEVYKGKLILYGCGDLLTDYEGIGGYEAFHGELGLLYLARLDPADGRLAALRMIPTRVRRLRLQRASPEETRWLADTLNREGRKLGTRVEVKKDLSLELHWLGEK